MHSDYFLRMIERFSQILASIKRARKEKNYPEALQQIQTNCQIFLNEDISSFLKYEPKQLVDHFKNNQILDSEKAIICADLIYELALICQEQQILDASLLFKEKALNLYCVAIPHEKTCQQFDYITKVSDLMIEMQNKIRSDDIQFNILQFQEFMNKTKAKIDVGNR